MTDLEKQYQTVINEIQKTINANLVPKILHEHNIKTLNECNKDNLSLKSQLKNAKSDLAKLQAEYGNRKLSDALKIDKLEARMKILEEENAELQNVKNELKNWKSDCNALKDQWQSDALKIDVLQAGMKTLELEKKTFEVKFDEVSLKLKLKTHEYDSLLKSKQNDRPVKLVFKSNETEKASTGTQTIKEEPKEIGVVNVPASSSSRPQDPPVKTGTKRTSKTVEDRKIAKAKRMKTENSNSTSRTTRKSIQNQRKFSCSHCFARWAVAIEYGYDGNPDKIGAPNPNDAIPTFSSLQDYEIHAQENDCNEVNCPVLCFALHTFGKNYEKWYRDTDSICKICDCRFGNRGDYERHMDVEHCNFNNMSNKQMFSIYQKYRNQFCLD